MSHTVSQPISDIRGPAAQRRENRAAKAKLPPSYDVHWSQRRKAEVVRAVRDKLITFDEARLRYLLSRSEFESWEQELEDA
ncbi:DUF1153 domain-containing protein [Alteriqipengyuania flavescens]|uniref:DUF1153 domain-containing protein n=1 Tax=Alteriqipengyuania flavescens TaxID=3053610 RepID=UPI0025B298AE|nr:DUF1153 domain-containing protein [Alteriqipengyuania flavescens]WJY18739.1 DUF1153 domain-containing protein [Alteriqipengyuania flavescens]WJY24679.1 DUF1153 domain-containing protein [Alteriqipengyuania flavescens]